MLGSLLNCSAFNVNQVVGGDVFAGSEFAPPQRHGRPRNPEDEAAHAEIATSQPAALLSSALPLRGSVG